MLSGVPPLGYRVQDRKLVIIDSEAEIVRAIFRLYAELGSVRLLKEELDVRGIKSKSWTSASGRLIGGKPFSRGALYLMLQNRIYRGEVIHKGQAHSGEHTPIIDQLLWDAVQTQLASNAAERNSGLRTRAPSLLAGMLFDNDRNRMTPSHAGKQGDRYRYYVSRPLITNQRDGSNALPNCRNVSMACRIGPLAFATCCHLALPLGFSFRFRVVTRPRLLPLADRLVGLLSGRDKIGL